MANNILLFIFILFESYHIYRVDKENRELISQNRELRKRIKSFYSDSYNLEIHDTIKDKF